MIIDTSALVAILFDEDDARTFAQAIADAAVRRLSVASFVETSIVLESRQRGRGAPQLDALIRRADIAIEPVTLEQALIARQAFADFGKGRHPAGLNFGDCFSYALARACDEPLLFKGLDFSRTDVSTVF